MVIEEAVTGFGGVEHWRRPSRDALKGEQGGTSEARKLRALSMTRMKAVGWHRGNFCCRTAVVDCRDTFANFSARFYIEPSEDHRVHRPRIQPSTNLISPVKRIESSSKFLAPFQNVEREPTFRAKIWRTYSVVVG